MLRSGGRLWSVDHGEANNFVVFSQRTLNFNLMTKHDVYYNQLIRTEIRNVGLEMHYSKLW